MASDRSSAPKGAVTGIATTSAPISAPGEETGKQKRERRSGPKVKTGCSNCKQRRIKCDEKRPSCTQCERSRKECTGYPPPPRYAASHAALRIAPRPMAAAPVQSNLAPRPSLLARDTVLPPRRVNRRQQIKQQQSRETSLVRGSPSSATPPPAQQNFPSPTIYRPSNNVPLQGAEVHYFDIFRAHTASELSGYFDSVFWTQRVLQECHVEPAIRHAAVALGALYKTLEQSSKTPSPTDSVASTPTASDLVMSHWQVAVRQYSEACNAMMLLNGQTHSNRTRLMSSVLLACFDAFIGDHKQAIIQIQNGLGLMGRLRAEQARGAKGVLKGPVEEELVNIFTRLAIQAKSYDLAFHFPEPYVIHLAPEDLETQTADSPYPEQRTFIPVYPTLDSYFTNLREARLAFDQLLEKGMRFVERLYLVKKQPYPLFPASWRQYGMAHQGHIDAWARAFQPLFESRHTSGLSAHERNGIATLKMSHINSKILFLCMFNSTESHFDVFAPQFQQIVDLGREVVADDERKAVNARCPYPDVCQHKRWDDPPDVLNGGYAAYHIKPSFSADLGIVPPLFVVATKCRDPYLRRKAIQLMRSSARREGMWDSELSARISQWVMQIEEETDPGDQNQQQPQPGLPLRIDTTQGSTNTSDYPPPPQVQFDGQHRTKPIPEEKRIMIHTIDFDLRARYAHITAGTRGATVSEGGDRRKRKTHIRW